VSLLRAHGVPSGRVLDVGAGYGFFLEALERAGYEAHGIELSEHAAGEARKRARGQVFVQGAEDPFPFPEGHFDAITMFDVIEHLPRYPVALSSCRRCLKPGGKLFVITLNAHSAARPLLGKRWAWYQDPTHVHMFTARMLREGFREAGLEVETLKTESNFCSVGEGTTFLKPLRVIGRVIHTPAFGDSLLAVAKKPG
jgi:2-polyprenyl-3-methyl-5-hydroxy-6-metoxy-1,4-benzoquinol methylase